MGVLLPFNEQLRTAFDFDYWLRLSMPFQSYRSYALFNAFSRLHNNTITSSQRQQVASKPCSCWPTSSELLTPLVIHSSRRTG